MYTETSKQCSRTDDYYIIRMDIGCGESAYISKSDRDNLRILDQTFFPYKAEEFEFERDAYSFIYEFCQKYKDVYSMDSFAVLKVKRHIEMQYAEQPINDLTRRMLASKKLYHSQQIREIEEIETK